MAETSNAPQNSGGRTWLWVLLGVVGLFVLTLAVIIAAVVFASGSSEGGSGGSRAATTSWDEEYVSGEGAEKIAVLPVNGAIIDDVGGGLLATQGATPDDAQSQLDQAADDESVRAIILEVNSPGGGLVASDEIHNSVVQFKEETDKPVVVSMGSSAASGGYYISAPADSIVAHPATITGSIGVILSYTRYGEALEQFGLEQEVFKSGEFKDIASPNREPTEEEQQILQDYIEEGYDQFVNVIVEGRDLPEDEVREIGDGRIYTGQQAQDLGLVDEVGDLEDAAGIARDLADIEEAEVVRYEDTPGLFDSLQARLAPSEPEILTALRSAGFNPRAELQAIYQPGL